MYAYSVFALTSYVSNLVISVFFQLSSTLLVTLGIQGGMNMKDKTKMSLVMRVLNQSDLLSPIDLSYLYQFSHTKINSQKTPVYEFIRVFHLLSLDSQNQVLEFAKACLENENPKVMS